MRSLQISTPVAVLVLTAAVGVSATTGAVAGSLVTGAQVKNESLTGKDVKNGSLKKTDLAAGLGATGPAGPAGTAGVSGIQHVMAFDDVSNGASGNLELACPAGKKLLSATAFWSTFPRTAVKVDYSPTLQNAFAVYQNTSGDEEFLTIEGVCATAG